MKLHIVGVFRVFAKVVEDLVVKVVVTFKMANRYDVTIFGVHFFNQIL